METKTILEQIKKDGIEFVSLQFTDLLGVVKEVIIPVKELEDALTNGVWFDGSSVEGFARIQESDLFLKPEPSTYSVIPWLNRNNEHGRTARLICDIYSADSSPFEGDPRFILKKAVAEAKKIGFEYNVGPEPEFFLFRKENQEGVGGEGGSGRTVSGTTPIDFSSYFDLTSHEGYKVIREIMSALKEFGIRVETSHHEVAEGQYEIDFEYGSALHVADMLLTLKSTVKKIAQMNGLNATFMPKPIMRANGNGMHVHQSLFDIKSKKNAFYDDGDKYGLSDTAYSFIAGQMKNIKAMSAVLSPTINSYKRLVPGYEAPIYITWANMNRSALIRVPRWFKEKPQAARIELRCPDPSCNPYLAFAVMLKAGLDGIKKKLKPAEPVEENVYQFDDESLAKKDIDTLPTSLPEAMAELKKSSLLKEAFGEGLFRRYIDIKTREINGFRIQVTKWEIDKYIDIY